MAPEQNESKRPQRKAAVALGYDPAKDDAPRILAAGQGELAEQLLKVARAHNVPVRADHPLAQALVKLEVGAAIPPELYAAVAEVLAFLWKLEQDKSTAGEANS